MRSPGLVLAAALSVATAGCAAPRPAALPSGLAYECDPGGPAMIRFDPGGYLPGQTVAARDGTPVPRSVARLDYRGAEHKMVAEWARFGLRYRSERERPDGTYLVWTGDAERAVIGEAAARTAEDRRIATCVRSGRVSPSGDPDGHAPGGHEDELRRR